MGATVVVVAVVAVEAVEAVEAAADAAVARAAVGVVQVALAVRALAVVRAAGVARAGLNPAVAAVGRVVGDQVPPARVGPDHQVVAADAGQVGRAAPGRADVDRVAATAAPR